MVSGFNAAFPKPASAKRELASTLVIPILLFIVFFALYSVTRTHFNTFDAVSYANQIERLYPRSHDPRWLFHPHHLLFNISGYAVHILLGLFGWHGSVLETLEAINAAFAAFGLGIFFRLLSRNTGRVGIPLAATLTLGLTYGYWVAATDGRVNMISAVFLLASFSVLSSPAPRSTVYAGMLAALGVLYHESALLFIPVGVLMAFSGNGFESTSQVKDRFRRAAIFAATCLATVIGAYLLVGIVILGLHSPQAFRHWSTQYAELGWWWDFHIGRNLPLDRQALLHTIVVPASSRVTGTGWLYSAALFGCIAAGICLIASTVLLWKRDRTVVEGCWAWMLIYAAFFTVWSPGYFIFWIPVVIAAACLTFTGIGAAASKPKIYGVVCILILAWCACVGSQNAAEGIVPHLQAEGSPFQRIAADIKQHTRPGDIVVLTGEGDLAECEVNTPYFADRDAISLHTTLARQHDDPGAAKAVIQAQIAATIRDGHDVFVLAEAHDPAGASALLAGRHPEATVPFMRDIYAPWTSQVSWRSDHGPVWILKERSAVKTRQQ